MPLLITVWDRLWLLLALLSSLSSSLWLLLLLLLLLLLPDEYLQVLVEDVSEAGRGDTEEGVPRE